MLLVYDGFADGSHRAEEIIDLIPVNKLRSDEGEEVADELLDEKFS